MQSCGVEAAAMAVAAAAVGHQSFLSLLFLFLPKLLVYVLRKLKAVDYPQ